MKEIKSLTHRIMFEKKKFYIHSQEKTKHIWLLNHEYQIPQKRGWEGQQYDNVNFSSNPPPPPPLIEQDLRI